MTIETLPLWPFRPNWSDSLVEGIEFLTSVLASPSGAEQRRALRFFPRRDFEYSLLLAFKERAWAENYLRNTSYSKYWLPLWADAVVLQAKQVNGQTVFPVPNASAREFAVGSPLALVDNTSCRIHDVLEVSAIGQDTVTVTAASTKQFVGDVTLAPALKGYLDPTQTAGLSFTRLTDSILTSSVKLIHAEPGSVNDETDVQNGPLILDGLIVNAWANSLGRGGYFHPNSGTSEGQFIFVHAALLMSNILADGTLEEKTASRWLRTLVYTMLDAMGDGGLNGPMLRQPIPSDPNTICELHWLFAARGDIPERNLVYAYEATTDDDGKVRVGEGARGANVYNVVMIYPATSQLLYDGIASPAYDIANPKNPTQTTLTTADWSLEQFTTAITPPAKNDQGESNAGITDWKIVYGYDDAALVPVKYAYEAYPDWTLISPGYAACAPDTFRWFDAAMDDVINFDTRAGNPQKWANLQRAMRRTCCKGQAIDDLRTILTPMPGFDAIPVSGDPTGMYCYSNNPNAQPPSVSGANPGWTGYTFWGRDDNGDLLGEIPDTGTGNLAQNQIGRGFTDTWRDTQTYQDPDWYMYIEIAVNRRLQKGELVLLYMSATQQYDKTSRWFADLSKIPGWEVKSGTDVCQLFVPISAFRTRTNDAVGSTTWGDYLKVGQTFQAYGFSVEVKSDITIRIRKLRPVGGASKEWVDSNQAEAILGAKMPFFPGSLPFAINADTVRQQFVGWNGSPFQGYQQPDLWCAMEDDANAVHPDLDPARDLPIPTDDGVLTFPINPTDAAGNAKTKAAMLAEQQTYFLVKAQAHYHQDGGALGPFAHTFVMNTPARSSLGNPTPYTWVYVNDDPNTRWIGYQVRPVESLCNLVRLAKGRTGWQDAHDLALTTARNWLDWFNGAWTDPHSHIFTDYPDPRISAPQQNYDEPHGAALILRACLWLKMTGDLPYADALMERLWTYLEYIWAYNQGTAMAGTWSDNPTAQDWYGFWHGEIIKTFCIMLSNPSMIPSGIDLTVVRQRLMDTYQWLRTSGVKTSAQSELDGFTNWNGYGVLDIVPNETGDMTRGHSRLMTTLDNTMAPPLFMDIGGQEFEQLQMTYRFMNRKELVNFVTFFYACRGQQVPFWMPTFMEDFKLVSDIRAGDTSIAVENVGYADYVFPDGKMVSIMIQYFDGTYDLRTITNAVAGDESEAIYFDEPIIENRPMTSVRRISYVNLTRFSQDRLELTYNAGKDSATDLTVTMQSAPELRTEEAAFYM